MIMMILYYDYDVFCYYIIIVITVFFMNMIWNIFIIRKYFFLIKIMITMIIIFIW